MSVPEPPATDYAGAVGECMSQDVMIAPVKHLQAVNENRSDAERAHKARATIKPPTPVRTIRGGVMVSDESNVVRSAAEERAYGRELGKVSPRSITDVRKIDFPEPELWNKGSDIFRMVSDKLEAKSANVASLFRKFDENKDGTVDYRELRQGLKNINLDLKDDEFQSLIDLVDADKSGDIDYQEFANADVMGSPLFAARQVQGNSGCKTLTQLQKARQLETRQFGLAKVHQFSGVQCSPLF
eukprot:SAG31_NODE_589_length_13808_cov_3.896710_12_plen_242_part_00